MRSSNGHGSSNGSGSDSAGKDNSPNEANEANEYGSTTHQRNSSLRGKRPAASRSAPENNVGNPDADPGLSSAGSRKRRASSNGALAYPAEPAAAQPARSGGQAARLQAGTSESGCSKASHGSAGSEVQARAGVKLAVPVGRDRRWIAGMCVDLDGAPRMALHDGDGDYADPQCHGHWADALVTSPLAEVKHFTTALRGSTAPSSSFPLSLPLSLSPSLPLSLSPSLPPSLPSFFLSLLFPLFHGIA